LLTLRNAPHVEQDGRACRDDLGESGSGIFLQGGTGQGNQLESKAEISILAQAVFASFRRTGRANRLGRRFLFEGRASVHPWTQRTVEARRRVT
jgi:hypothetical protein